MLDGSVFFLTVEMQIDANLSCKPDANYADAVENASKRSRICIDKH